MKSEPAGNHTSAIGQPNAIESINPLNPTDQDLTLEDWYCSVVTYESGKVVCRAPKLSQYDPDSLQYNVDISLNGQQFSGYPIIFRYYGKFFILY